MMMHYFADSYSGSGRRVDSETDWRRRQPISDEHRGHVSFARLRYHISSESQSARRCLLEHAVLVSTANSRHAARWEVMLREFLRCGDFPPRDLRVASQCRQQNCILLWGTSPGNPPPPDGTRNRSVVVPKREGKGVRIPYIGSNITCALYVTRISI